MILGYLPSKKEREAPTQYVLLSNTRSKTPPGNTRDQSKIRIQSVKDGSEIGIQSDGSEIGTRVVQSNMKSDGTLSVRSVGDGGDRQLLFGYQMSTSPISHALQKKKTQYLSGNPRIHQVVHACIYTYVHDITPFRSAVRGRMCVPFVTLPH